MIAIDSPDAMLALGMGIGGTLEVGDAIGIEGPMGAGKTVLARGILRGLGYHGDVPSPSFPIVIPYRPPAVRVTVAHFDLYRIDDKDSLAELGFDDARTEGALVVEWPRRLGDLGWNDILMLSLTVADDGTRRLTSLVPPAWERRWPPR